MKIAYFDLISGASGDMILGALVDAGLSIFELEESLAALELSDFDLRAYPVTKNNFSATKVDVVVKNHVPERHLPDIEAIITGSKLSNHIQQKALDIFQCLGRVEAGIHNTSIQNVHLHELGGVDTIVDVVGTLLAVEALGIKKIYSSPMPLGRGVIKGAHGKIPLPAPATVALLKGVPIVGSELMAETITPTGAVLLTSLAEGYGPIPQMRLQTIGYGAGGRDLPIPNILRILIGEQDSTPGINTDILSVIETNIDDLNPEIYSYVMEKLFTVGALDVYWTPMHMKKNRLGTQLSVLCREQDTIKVRDILFLETSTLGVRETSIRRYSLNREVKKIKTPWGQHSIKIARLPDGEIKFSPEFEECREIARKNKIPLQEVYITIIGTARNVL